VAAVLGGCDQSELRGIGAIAEHKPGGEEGVDDQLALLAGAGGRTVRAVGHRPSGDRGEVLDRQRHTQEGRLRTRGQAPVGLGRGGPRFIVVAPGHGIQLSVALVDRGQAGVEQLNGGQLATAQRRGQLQGRTRGTERIHVASL